MKRLLKYLASAAMLLSPLAAHSADLAVKAPPPPVFSWTGFYIGANIGGAWANNNWTADELQQLQQRRIHIVAA